MRAVLYATLGESRTHQKTVRHSRQRPQDRRIRRKQLAAEIPEADALFMGDMLYVGKTREAIMTTAKKLKWIQILTAGYDNAKQFGVPAGVQVTNVGDALAPAVAVHAVSLLLTLQRQVPAFVKNQEKHGWDRSAAAKAVIPLGQTCAVLGFGFIGREIARLMRAMGSHVIGVSRTGAPDTGADEMQPIAKLDDVLKRSDSIMISLPLDSATHHLINARTLGLCKKNAIIVNIARGGIIDQIALTEALKNGTIAGAGLDVTDPGAAAAGTHFVGCAEPLPLAPLRGRCRQHHDRSHSWRRRGKLRTLQDAATR